MELLREIRNIDSDRIIINVPKEFRKKRVEILVFPLKNSKKEEKKEKLAASGLCGIWKDERNPEEIVNDIYSHRTGFGKRVVSLFLVPGEFYKMSKKKRRGC